MAHICSLIKDLRTPKKYREIDFGLVRWGNFKKKKEREKRCDTEGKKRVSGNYKRSLNPKDAMYILSSKDVSRVNK